MGDQDAGGEPTQGGGSVLRLGQQGERDEGVGGEQVERHRPVARGGQHPIERSRARLRQGVGNAAVGGRGSGILSNAAPERIGRPRRMLIEPGRERP